MTDTEGPLKTEAYLCKAKGERLVLTEITLPPLKATDVELDMTHCGLCHTDIHMRDNDWGISDYPLVLGHEGIGTVRKVGSSVKTLKVGDVVGVTWVRDSCACCEFCMESRENLCQSGYQGTFLGPSAGCWGKDPHHEFGGCFSKVMRINEKFCPKLPDGLPPTVACPLICGGGTVFEAVADYVTPGKKVAVASIGGLGTAAIKFAAAYGGHVTALSRTAAKKDKCLAVGAKEFSACLGNAELMKENSGKFDVIIDTSPANADLAPFMDMLKINGTYCRVGIPPHSDQTFSYNFLPLIFTQKKIAGSIVTGMKRMNLMLQLTADNLETLGKDPDDWTTETVPFDQVNETMDKLQGGKNTTNWRYILKW